MNDSRKKIEIVFKRSGLSQVAFAKKVGITDSYVSKLLNPKEKINPSATLINSICHAFNIDLEWFYSEKDEPLRVAEPKPEYKPHGDWQPSQDMLSSEEWNLIGKAHEIIKSKTAYSSALISSINAFYHAMKDDDTKGLNGEQKGENTEKKVM
jgi:transcriptional regulator with XRE-family HTH domain